ncbi:MAG: hypothetical protein AABX83_00475 [Nanoarchaeota archaeon]
MANKKLGKLNDLFNNGKSPNFILTDSSKDHASGIITSNLRRISSLYTRIQRYNLIDYLSEWTAKYPKDSPVDAINKRLNVRFYESRRSDQERQEFPSFEKYLDNVFREHASTPESLMEYILEREWEPVKDRIQNRNNEERMYWASKIKMGI